MYNLQPVICEIIQNAQMIYDVNLQSYLQS